MMRKIFCVIFLVGILWTMPVYAMESSEDFDYEDIQKAMDAMLPNELRISFSEVVEQLVSGNLEGLFKHIKTYVLEQLVYEIKQHKTLLTQLLGIILMSAVFTNFSMAFSKTQIAETGFYLTYMLLFTLLLTSFMSAAEIAATVIRHMLSFMSALVPVFCLAVTMTGNIQTGLWYQQLMVVGVTLIEWLVSKGILKLVHMYVLLSMVNQVSKEDVLSKCTELLHTVAVWSVRTVLGTLLGLQFIQGLVLPAFDTLKNGWTARLTSALPGIGDTMGSVLQTVMGSAVLIKNGIGAAGMLILALLFLIPMIKLVFIAVMYMLAQVLIQPVADKRMLECLHAVSDGVILLLKIVGTVFVLFFLSMAMMTSASGAVFGG